MIKWVMDEYSVFFLLMGKGTIEVRFSRGGGRWWKKKEEGRKEEEEKEREREREREKERESLQSVWWAFVFVFCYAALHCFLWFHEICSLMLGKQGFSMRMEKPVFHLFFIKLSVTFWMLPRISITGYVRRSVRRSVRPSVRLSVRNAFVKSGEMKNLQRK